GGLFLSLGHHLGLLHFRFAFHGLGSSRLDHTHLSIYKNMRISSFASVFCDLDVTNHQQNAFSNMLQACVLCFAQQI
ncbi:MAG: hypothetical protein KGL00_10560, partial [Gammaproteobacteria bacterium]|nr:hypothetical protein [Gammaproteobacteria bacterium]